MGREKRALRSVEEKAHFAEKQRIRRKEKTITDPEYVKRVALKHAEYCKKHKNILNEKRRYRVSSIPAVKLAQNLRGRLYKGLARENSRKFTSTNDLLGCSFQWLKTYLESLWQPGMSWENYGYRGWHIDHIVPCAAFDLTNLEQQKQCFHYTNLQPLWRIDNMSKQDRLDWNL